MKECKKSVHRETLLRRSFKLKMYPLADSPDTEPRAIVAAAKNPFAGPSLPMRGEVKVVPTGAAKAIRCSPTSDIFYEIVLGTYPI